MTERADETHPTTSKRQESPTRPEPLKFAPSNPLVSIVVPAYNEEDVIQGGLESICKHLDAHAHDYEWEVIVVNDGSSDKTGDIAEAFAGTRQDVRVLHHRVNFGLGQALRYAFSVSKGDYIVTMDVDLTYSAEHIPLLLSRLQTTGAKVVATSPYMKGGTTTAVPWLRKILSLGANRFLALASTGNLSTLTGMVRAYDGIFLRGLDLRSMGMEINPEIIYKAMLLGARVDEVPAHLDWGSLRRAETQRRSSLKIFRQILAVLISGFLFRPVMFFILPGMLLLAFAMYPTAWMFTHFFNYFFGEFADISWIPSRASQSVAAAFDLAPHTFVVAGMSWMVGIQLVSLGILALQNKNYFEEVFHLGSTLLRDQRRSRNS